jgi:hypothetical protein
MEGTYGATDAVALLMAETETLSEPRRDGPPRAPLAAIDWFGDGSSRAEDAARLARMIARPAVAAPGRSPSARRPRGRVRAKAFDGPPAVAVVRARARWTADEDSVLRALAATPGAARAIAARLPGRSACAAEHRARRLGVALAPAPRATGAVWTRDELETLQREWQDVTVATMRRKLPGRTVGAIGAKARALGLPMGVPQGCLSLTEAAQRSCYGVPQLRAMLAAVGARAHRVPVYRSAARPRPRPADAGKARPRTHRWYVDAEDLERAEKARGLLEVVGAYAARHGLSRGSLYGWLRLAGHLPPCPDAGVIAPPPGTPTPEEAPAGAPSRPPRRRWLMATETLDAVVAQARARRAGVAPGQLALALPSAVAAA